MKYELKECTLIPYPYNGSVTAQIVDGRTIAYFKVKNSKVGNIYDQYFIGKPHLPYTYMPTKSVNT